MGVYDQDIAVAKELIAFYGVACLWQKPAPLVEAEPGYPTLGAEPDPILCDLAFFSRRDLGRGTEEFLSLLAGVEVPANSEIGLLAGDIAFTPELTDTLTRNGQVLSIASIDRLAPSGVPVLYYVTVAA